MIKSVSKPGSVLEMDNKRGVFITETISKIYERVLKNRNNEEIDEYSILISIVDCRAR